MDEVQEALNLSGIDIDLNEEIEHNEGSPEEKFVDNLQLQITPGGRNENREVLVATPTVGMTYETWEEIDLHFRCYAKQNGFAVSRVGSGYRQKDGVITKVKRNVTWRCEQCGVNKSESSNSEISAPVMNIPNTRSRAAKSRAGGGMVKKRVTSVGHGGVTVAEGKTKKCNCPVMVYASASRDGTVWTIKKAILQHEGHVPSLSKNRYIAEYRLAEWNPAIRRRLFNDLEAGIKIPQIHRGLARERNGIENFPLTQRGLRNAAMKKRQLEMKGGDANAMYAYLRRMSEDNDKFYYFYRLDEHGSLKDVMWVDARSRAAYEYFGDVVCFDSTYITNDFELPFANFVGVNHHGQTILLGCALISREDTETFMWLFSKWKECMGKGPVGILTDQDAALKKALALVMPESRHRWCLWHILQKFYQKLGAYEHYETISDQLQNAIYDSLTSEEFNESWCEVIKAYKLEENEWLQGLFDNCEMWIPAYMKHLFWAGMKTTQRSESINSFFDKYVTKKTRLYQFVQQYVNAMEVRLNDERAADADSTRNLPHTFSNFPLEKTFRKFYTNSKFAEVQLECAKTMYVRPMKVEQITDQVMDITLTDKHYILNKKTRKEYVTDKRRHYKVQFHKCTKEAQCVCRLFECHGIVCRHIIALFDTHDVKEIPEKYILDRWRKDIKRKHSKIKIGYYDPSKTEDVKRLDRLNVAFEPLSLEACTTEEDVALVLDMIEKTKLLIAERRANAGKSSGQADNILGTPSSVGNDKGNEGLSQGGKVAEGICGAEHADDSHEGDDEGVSDGIPYIKDPPMKPKPAHRGRERRFLSCIERNASRGRKRTRATGPPVLQLSTQEAQVPVNYPLQGPLVNENQPYHAQFPPHRQPEHQAQLPIQPQMSICSYGQTSFPTSLIPEYAPSHPYQFQNMSTHHHSTVAPVMSDDNGIGFAQPRPFGLGGNHLPSPSSFAQYPFPDWYIRDCDLLNFPDPSEQHSTGDAFSTPCGSTT